MTLDSILNVLIPVGIFIGIAIFIYGKGKEHIDKFFVMVKSWFENRGNSDEQEMSGPRDYRIEPSDYRIEYRES